MIVLKLCSGWIFSVEPLHRTFLLGSVIELQINVSTDNLARHIRTLMWYHNEIEVQSSGRVSVLNNGTRIIIHDATHRDAGNYKVKIASLDFDDPVCGSLWLPVLRNHAAHAPVTFAIKLMNESSSDEYPYTENTMAPLQYYPLVNSDSNTLFTISHDTDLSSSWTSSIIASAIRSGYLSSSLNVNGSRLASDASKFNISQTAMESGVLTQVINFRYSFSDEGFYVHSLYLSDPYYLLHVPMDHIYRCFNYYEYADDLRLNRISFIIFPFILTTYSE
jgi:hypothetical protein